MNRSSKSDFMLQLNSILTYRIYLTNFNCPALNYFIPPPKKRLPIFALLKFNLKEQFTWL